MTLMKRSVINPVMAISGGLTTLSGFFLMFHYESHFAKAIHQISGLLFIIFGIMHIVINRTGLAKSLSGRIPVWAMAVLFAVCIAIMAATGVKTPHRTVEGKFRSSYNLGDRVKGGHASHKIRSAYLRVNATVDVK